MFSPFLSCFKSQIKTQFYKLKCDFSLVFSIFASQGFMINSAPLQPLADLANVYMACVFWVLVGFFYLRILYKVNHKNPMDWIYLY